MIERTILVVDDDTILLESIADLLLLSDFRVKTASNGAEALELLKKEDLPDCIISDVMMPEMDGYGLLEAVRAHESWSSIPVILITAYDRPFSSRTKQDITPDAVLSKPFDVDHLIHVVREQFS